MDIWLNLTFILPLWTVAANHRKHLKWLYRSTTHSATANCRSKGLIILAHNCLLFCLLKHKWKAYAMSHILLPFLLLPAFSKTNVGFTPSLFGKRWWSGHQPTSGIRCLVTAYQFQQIGSCWLRSKTQLQCMLNMSKCVYKHMVPLYVYLGYVKIPMLPNTHLQMEWQSPMTQQMEYA